MSDVSRSYIINTYSYTFSHTAIGCLRHLVERGFNGFELMMFPGHIWPAQTPRAQRRELLDFLHSNGAEIRTLNQPNIDINIGAATPEMREYSVSAIEKMIVLAADLECRGVIVGPGKPNALLPAPAAVLQDRFFAALDRFVPLGEKLGVQILVENMPFAFVPDAESMMATVERYGDDSIGVVYDVANAAFIGEDVVQGLERVASRLAYVHLSDTPADVCRHDPVENKGIVPFAAAAQAAERIGHRNPPIIEIVSSDPDKDIDISMDCLGEAGWRP